MSNTLDNTNQLRSAPKTLSGNSAIQSGGGSGDAVSIRGRTITTGTPADGDVMQYELATNTWTYVPNSGAGVSIYSNDGTLAGNRAVNTAGNTLNFTNNDEIIITGDSATDSDLILRNGGTDTRFRMASTGALQMSHNGLDFIDITGVTLNFAPSLSWGTINIGNALSLGNVLNMQASIVNFPKHDVAFGDASDTPGTTSNLNVLTPNGVLNVGNNSMSTILHNVTVNGDFGVGGSIALGHLLAGDGTTMVDFPNGANGEVLIADNTQPSGLRWGTSGGSVPDPLNLNRLNVNQLYGNAFAMPTSSGLFLDSSAGSPGAIQTVVYGPGAGNWSTGLTTGSSNTNIGFNSGGSCTAGVANVSVGRDALAAATIGSSTCAIGDHAMFVNATGGNNCAFGYFAGAGVTASSGGIFIGWECCRSQDPGAKQIIIGNDAGSDGGDNSIIMGSNAGNNLSGIVNSILMGTDAGNGATTRANLTNSVLLGHDVNVTADNVASSVCVGNGCLVNASNQISIGTAAECLSAAGGGIAIGTLSSCDGLNTTACGFTCEASGAQSSAYGDRARATNTDACAYGRQSLASGIQSSCFGAFCEADGPRSTSLGYNAICGSGATSGISIGDSSSCQSNFGISIGDNASVPVGCEDSISIGRASSTVSTDATACGVGSSAGYRSTCLGSSATDGGNVQCVVIGHSSTVTGANAVSCGNNATAASSSVSIGLNATASGNNSCCISANSCTGTNSTCIGFGCTNPQANSLVCGRSATASGGNSVSCGNSSNSGASGVAIGFDADSSLATGGVALGLNANTGANDYRVQLGEATVSGSNAQMNFRSQTVCSETFISGSVTNLEVDASGNFQLTPSDRESKKEIEEVNTEKAIEIVRNLKPVSFKYKDEEKFGADKTLGFIAQDVYAACSDNFDVMRKTGRMIASDDETERPELSYAKDQMPVLLWSTVQHLLEKVDLLESMIKKQNSVINKLRKTKKQQYNH